jgi:DNA-damage-inducible protein J
MDFESAEREKIHGWLICRATHKVNKEVEAMAQVLVNVRMDEDLKKNMDETCKELGINMSTAFVIFAKKMTREKRIPFEVSVDPFYSDANMNYLKKVISEIESGKTKLVEHDIIEE